MSWPQYSGHVIFPCPPAHWESCTLLPSGLVSSAFSRGVWQWAQVAFTAMWHLLQVYVAIMNLQVVTSRHVQRRTTLPFIQDWVCRAYLAISVAPVSV